MAVPVSSLAPKHSERLSRRCLNAEYQLSNDLGLFFSAEETGKEASSKNVIDVLEETLEKEDVKLAR